MSRPIEDIQVDLNEVKAELIRLGERKCALEEELRLRREEDARAEPHPWLGKKVKYEDRQRIRAYGGYRTVGQRTVTFRGTVVIFTEEMRRQRINGLGYSKVGDFVVISNTGKKGWTLHQGWQLDEEA
jgi:hypothetical protein